MSQFAFANELKNCVRMDEPITKGPIPRWQKKCVEASNLRFALCSISSDFTQIWMVDLRKLMFKLFCEAILSLIITLEFCWKLVNEFSHSINPYRKQVFIGCGNGHN
jgi:hypothetical protein